MSKIAKLRITPVVGKDKKIYRHANLMPGVKYEDLTVEDFIKAEKTFQELFNNGQNSKD